MPKAIWNDAVLADSEDTVMVDGNHYFPADALDRQYFQPSETQSVCGWKGTASYYHVQVGERKNADAAWYYADPKSDAQQLKGRVAFWKGVEVLG